MDLQRKGKDFTRMIFKVFWGERVRRKRLPRTWGGGWPGGHRWLSSPCATVSCRGDVEKAGVFQHGLVVVRVPSL